MLTEKEIKIVEGFLPFMEMDNGPEREELLTHFMRMALTLDFHGPEHFIDHIETVDENGETIRLEYEPGDDSVGLSGGWIIV